jgi:hypothetical protein
MLSKGVAQHERLTIPVGRDMKSTSPLTVLEAQCMHTQVTGQKVQDMLLISRQRIAL